MVHGAELNAQYAWRYPAAGDWGTDAAATGCPRAASRCLHCVRQPVGTVQTGLPAPAAPFAASMRRILASFLRSALWIIR